LLVALMVLSSFSMIVQAAPEDGAGHDFDQMLEQLRQELFSPVAPVDSGRERVYVDMDDMSHTPFEFGSHGDDGGDGVVPFGFVAQDYQEGSTRLFRAQIWPGSAAEAIIQGDLVRQGQHVNIWVLDPDAYESALGPALSQQLAGQNMYEGQHVLARVMENATLLDDMAARFDGIIERMTQGFGAFAGVRVVTPFAHLPYVGDVHLDGRVNVLLYNVRGDGTLGFFNPRDFYMVGGNTPLAMVHVDISRGRGYTTATQLLDNPSLTQAGIYYTFAHELQHLLFHMHLGVYLTNALQWDFLWFNEALSDYAGHFYTASGAELVSQTVFSASSIINAAGNSYFRSGSTRAGDFINFNNTAKNYAMGRLHATLMHRLTDGAYASAVYNFFSTEFPPATTGVDFFLHRNRIESAGMSEILGGAFDAAVLTGSTGATGEEAFALLYFLFMENFAADGGDIIGGGTAHPTIPFFDDTSSALRLWGIRPTLGVGPVFHRFWDEWSGQSGGWRTDGFFLNTRDALPDLAPGATVSMAGYNSPIPLGATHERMHRLNGESETNPLLTISVNDNDPRTRYYVVVPNDAPGVISSTSHITLGSTGATVYPLIGNNVVNVIDTGGQVAYLFVVTLFRNVAGVEVNYSWGSGMDTTTPSPTPTPSPPPVASVTSWAELRAAINAVPAGIPTTIEIAGSFEAPRGAIGDMIVIPENRDITLVSTNVANGADNMRTLGQFGYSTASGTILARNRSHFSVSASSSLTLSNNITLLGGIQPAGGGQSGSGGVRVDDGGKLIMDSGSAIVRSGRQGEGAVRVSGGGEFIMLPGSMMEHNIWSAVVLIGSGAEEATRARFTMLGGVIRDNSGVNAGGVDIGINSIFVMEGNSAIYNNRVTAASMTSAAGGVFVRADTSVFEMRDAATIRNHAKTGFAHVGGVGISRGIFTMYGGSITENSNSVMQSNAPSSGGVIVWSGTFIMHDGSITDNDTYSGVNLNWDSATFMMYGGKISNNVGIGVRVSGGTMTMYGGAISGNIGSGVQLNSSNQNTSTFIMHGGIINDNAYTGVALLRSASFTMSGGTISGNMRGVKVLGGQSTFSMTHNDARIENNHAVGADAFGGGILIEGGGIVNITAGVITGNSAQRGGGVFVSSTPWRAFAFNMTGGSITNNTATYNGGGIYSTRASHLGVVPATAFDNINIGPDVIFSGNTAGNGHSAPPDNRLPHIASTTTSIWNYAQNPLNNYDINYTGRLNQEHGISTWAQLRAAVNAAPANVRNLTERR